MKIDSRGARRPERGKNTEHHRRSNGDRRRVCQYRTIHPELEDRWQSGRERRHDRPIAPRREEEAERTSHARENETLGQHLAHHAHSSRPECDADRDLAAAAAGPGEEQVGDVHGRHQQHEADGSEEHHRCLLRHLTHHLCVQADDVRAPSLVLLVLHLEPLGDQAQLSLGLIDARSFGETRDRLHVVAAALARSRVEAEREKHIGPLVQEQKVRRQEADDNELISVQCEGRPQHVRVPGEASFPETVGYDHDTVSPVILGKKVTTPRRGYAKHAKQVRGRADCRYELGGVTAGEVELVVAEDCQILERRHPSAPVPRIRRVDAGTAQAEARLNRPHGNKLLGAFVGQGCENNPVDDREHGNVGPDPKCDRQDRRYGEYWPPPQ